ncbi:MarR family winged helix-turn-helix transcriptional regulator [Methanocella sp. MCL-LM]|uniref:MarR family winged helix-turn-helix transcriptional regulator n=1 Tax=Methanocella sp. MCL-LM TaxID=3412035 RepID=UPI003C71C143
MDVGWDRDPLPCSAPEGDWKEMSPEMSRLTASPSYLLLEVIHSWQKRIKEKLADFDLTSTQLTMLASLMVMTKNGKLVTQADLASFQNADKMMVSEVLRALEKKGYIDRQEHPVDRRARSLVITDKGRETIDVALKEAIRFDEEFFAAVGEDMDTFIKILKRLL